MKKGFLPIPIFIVIGSLILGSSALFLSKRFNLSKKPNVEEKQLDRSVDINKLEQPSPSSLPSPLAGPVIYQTPSTPPTPPPKPSSSQSVQGLRLDSVTQVSGSLTAIALKGVGFGTIKGNVGFIDPNSGASYSASISGWNDTAVDVVIPEMVNCTQTMQVYVLTSKNQWSNKVSFSYQNCVGIDSITPPDVKPYQGTINIKGKGFGASQGYISFSYPSNSNTVGSCVIESWSDTLVVCKDISVPSGGANYNIRVRRADSLYSKPVLYHVGSN